MIEPKKSLGQNFLIDQNIISKIINISPIKNNHVLEIGPGKGELTSAILEKKPRSLILIEKDTRLCKILLEKFKNIENIKIYNDDILKVNLENKIKNGTIIFGNLPYNISTQILVRLIKFIHWPPKYKKLILMFQKEVADRILAKKNTSSFGRLSVISNWRLKIKKSFNISKNCFFPKPKVESSLLVFEPINNKRFIIKHIHNLEKVTQILFSSKRKMINKAIKVLFKKNMSKIKTLNIEMKSRPGELSLEEYYRITEIFEK
ncbi:MAG: ribosomal RNA small subunit methyltransferase A [Candidatus Pelagibacter sp. TMED106]|nr:MAG: ribosomal RNA small subunit methyltransferase A [Candidatus Pelagibacter sp. TMED106]|tara:strand:- start:2499 stop:3284 length:786 start_codon:yes stop_codon:yes gene_type:complete